MREIGVELSTLKRVISQINNEKVLLGNIKPEDSDQEAEIARARNAAKFEVLRQLFGYDYVQGVIDEALMGS
jgi:hypothetical protein